MKRYQEIKSLTEKLIKRGETAEFFNRETLDIIMDDRITAAEIMLNGGNVQEFYRGSETLKTEFYNKNSCAYCALLEILTENKKPFTVEIIVDGIGGIFTEKVKADNERQAGIFGLKKFYDEFPEYRGNGKIYNMKELTAA